MVGKWFDRIASWVTALGTIALVYYAYLSLPHMASVSGSNDPSSVPWFSRKAALWPVFVLAPLLLGLLAIRLRSTFSLVFGRTSERQKRDNETKLLSSKIYNAWCYTSFDRLENDHILAVTLSFFNASDQTITIKNVAGYVNLQSDTNLGVPHPIKWTEKRLDFLLAKPLGEIHISLEQLLLPLTAAKVMELIKQKMRLTFEFRLQIEVDARPLGAMCQLTTWQGVSCHTPDFPMTTGRIIMAAGRSTT